MKFRLFLMAMAGVALASCVNDEVNQVQEEKKVKIAFETPVLYNNSESRANVYGEIGSHQYTNAGVIYSYPKDESFIIYAVAHEGRFDGWKADEEYAFNGFAISHDQALDGWAPKTPAGDPQGEGKYYFWPTSKLMTFAATSPADLAVNGATRSYDATGLKINDFEVAGDASKQYDLLFSQRSCNRSSADMLHSASYYSGIPIQFQHALSSIRFSLSNTSGEEVVLKKITLMGAKYKGNFAENITELGDKTIYDREGDDANVKPAWNVKDDTISTAYLAFNGSVTFPENPQYVSALASTTDTWNQLLLLPQDLTNAVRIKVDYTVNGQEATKTVILDQLKDTENNLVESWEMGVRYIYRLVYSAESAAKDKIYFSPSSDQWFEHKAIVVPLI